MPQQPQPDQLDGIDGEALDDMIRGEGWRLVSARLAASRAQLFESWAAKGENSEFMRGKAAGLAQAIALPRQMAQEIVARAKK